MSVEVEREPVGPRRPFHGAPGRPLDPQEMAELAAAAREFDRPNQPIGLGRLIATIGLSAVVASAVVMMVPSLRQPGAASSSLDGIPHVTAGASLDRRSGDEAARSAISQFQPLLASPEPSAAAAGRGQSEALLRQFMQWRQSSGPVGAAESE